MRLLSKLTPALLLPLAISALASADTLHLTDGSTIADCTIVKEGLLTVTYKEGNKRNEVDADKVLAVKFARKPQLVDRADTAVEEDALLDAVDDLEEFLAEEADKSSKRFPWANTYALFRLIEINEAMGEHVAVSNAADRLVAADSDSRYVPFAYIKKAEALNQLDKGAQALSALEKLGQLISDQGLSERWRFERELATILFDGNLTGKKRRDKLESVSAGAGNAHPLVFSRAEVAIAESLLEENKVDEAEAKLRDVIAAQRADSRTLAAAYTGLGDALFKRGTKSNTDGGDGSEVLREALKNYMRVVVVYKQELRYVPKAMFYAGRCFQQFNDAESKARANQVYTSLIRQFEGPWADEARQFRKRMP